MAVSLKKNIKIQLIGNVLYAVIGMGIWALLGRLLGPAGRGLLGLAIVIPDILANIFIFGQDMVNTTYAGLYPDRRKSLFLQTFFVGVLGTLIACGGIAFFYFTPAIPKARFEDITDSMVWMSMILVPGYLFGRSFMGLARGCDRITLSVLQQLTQAGTLLMLIIILAFSKTLTPASAVILTAVSWLSAAVLGIWDLRQYASFRRSSLSISLFKRSSLFGIQASVSTIAGILVLRLDQMILGYMVPLEQVGLYIIAVQLAERLRILPNSIAQAFLPKLANDLTTRRQDVPRTFRLTLLISLLSMLIFAGAGMVLIFGLLGAEYFGSILPFLILLPGVALLGGASILGSYLVAREKPGYSVIIGYTILLMNVVLNVLLIPPLGISGAAVASLISYTCAFILWILFYAHESKTSIGALCIRWQDGIDLGRELQAAIRHNWKTYISKSKP